MSETETATVVDEVIDENNFSKYFKDVRNNVIQKGEVISRYTSFAEFVDGNEKRQIIYLVKNTDKMEATAQVMRKLLFASEIDAYRIPRMMAEDMAGGMTEDECAAKVYKYTLEMFFYVNPQHVPKDDPHWSIISVLNLEEYLNKNISQGKENGLEFKAKVLTPEENEALNKEIKEKEEKNKEQNQNDEGTEQSRQS